MDYYLHNTSRSVHTRVNRYTAPKHGGAKQFLGGVRILRGRPVTISEDELLKNLAELQERVDSGWLEVRVADGRKFDLRTLQAVGTLETFVLPHPVPDSIANDKPRGRPMPIYPDGAVQLVSQPPAATEATQDDDDADVEFHDTSYEPKRSRKGKR